jgi:hypothetical protein
MPTNSNSYDTKKTKKSRKWWEEARIGKENDARVKISNKDKEKIKRLYHTEEWSIRAIARLGICSRRSIQLILFPERAERMKEMKKEKKVWREYYDRRKRRDYVRKYRQRLKEINNTK